MMNPGGARRASLSEASEAALVFVLTIAVFAQSIGFALTNWDDDRFIADNPFVVGPGVQSALDGFSKTHCAYYAPFLWLAFRAQFAIWKLYPHGYHAVNVFLHGVCAVLVMLIARELGLRRRGATLAALLWALHPLRVESVAWAVELKDCLSGAFGFASALFFLKSRPARSLLNSGPDNQKPGIPSPSDFLCVKYWLSVFLLLLALGTKPVVFIWPALAALLLLFPLIVKSEPDRAASGNRDKYDVRVLARHCFKACMTLLPHAALGLAGALVMLLVQQRYGGAYPEHALDLGRAAIVVPYSLSFHLVKIFLPFNLSTIYFLPLPATIASVWYAVPFGFAVFCLLLAVREFNRSPIVTWCLAYYAAGMLPYAQIVPSYLPLGDRYTYLGSIGFALGFGSFLGRMADSALRPGAGSRAGIAAAAAVILPVAFFSALTLARLPVWKDSISLWSPVIQRYPQLAEARNAMGVSLHMAGRRTEAEVQFRAAIRYKPDYELPYVSLARIIAERVEQRGGRPTNAELAEADALLKKVMDLGIRDDRAIHAYVGTALRLGLAERAAPAVGALAETRTHAPGLFAYSGFRFLVHGMPSEAAVCMHRAAMEMPGDAAAWYALGMALREAGKPDDAERIFAKARTMTPDESLFRAFDARLEQARSELKRP
ncbi:MAG TPA: tetratricopeptide repeat protein [Candidatus Brocadiia bacterium]|nr:tetratricopeptide repeat protein [Candidatus Brocadiia bacterium]